MGRKRKYTDEERKERKKLSKAKYNAANKEKIKERRAKDYATNKEQENKRSAKWRKDNKERVKESNAKMRKDNKHKPVVYYLPKENYVGTTECLYFRLSGHKSSGKNIEGCKVLREFNTRAEAIRLEKAMHILGYEGKHRFNKY